MHPHEDRIVRILFIDRGSNSRSPTLHSFSMAKWPWRRSIEVARRFAAVLYVHRKSSRKRSNIILVFFLLILCALFVEYYTQVRKRTAAAMFVSCSTADRSRWCAQLAHSQCHDIEEWVSPLQVTFIQPECGGLLLPLS